MNKAIPYKLNITKPIGVINVISMGINHVQINCISDNYEIKFVFDRMWGYENREEFFSRDPLNKFEFERVDGASFNYPINHVDYDNFKQYLSGHETHLCNSKTKLWIFLSLVNCIELYSDQVPHVEFKQT